MTTFSFLLGLILNFILYYIVAGVSDQFSYSAGFSHANLSVDGTATVTSTGLLELTNGTNDVEGHAFFPTPLKFRKSPNETIQSFSVSFIFAILSIYTDKSAEGMAFFVAPSMNFSSALQAQYLGLLNTQNNGDIRNQIFAVELDTIQNNEFKDINDNHVGIDINSLHSVESYYAGFYNGGMNSVFNNMTLVSREEIQVWIEYDRESTLISVTLAPLRVSKPTRPLVSTTYNLSTVLTDQAYIGFSAATSAIDSRHYVLGWSFSMNGPAPDIDINSLPKLPRVDPKAHSKALEAILPAATAAAIISLGTVIVIFVRRRMKFAELQEDWEVEFGPNRLSYKDLFHATSGFKKKNLIGTGGFGKVYKGVLPVSKLEVAVKRVSHESRQGIKEFVAEIVSIGRIRHRNLVHLLGYCRRQGEFLLVYDYMPNGSLDKYLYCQQGMPTLGWTQRFHIIKGIACGLLYLHDKWEKVVIHRDIKASNVLIDGEMNGRLGDFGLARLYDHGTDPETTHIVGTMGYLAPELVRTGKASTLTDVFAFGTFLLEVTCGRRPVEVNMQGNRFLLVDWVLEHWNKQSLIETVDMRLQGNCNIDEVCLVLKLGLMCSHPIVSARPSMREVVRYLNSEVPVPELTPTHFSFNVLASIQNEGLLEPSDVPYTP